MMLVHKQSNFNLPTTPYNHHRRHPSAPVVVQATRTPGLLSLSKPAHQQQQQPSQQHRQRSSPKAKQVQAQKPSSQPVQATATALKPSPEIAEKASPSRGRQVNKPKDKQTRSSSHSSVRAGRRPNNGRQPSPPLNPSQAEVHSKSTSTRNPFDPFLDDSPRPKPASRVPQAPTLASRPSGKLARRRQRTTASSTPAQSPSKPIPVPYARHHSSNSLPMSRSDPLLSHMHRQKSSTFPICDDMTEVGNDEDLPSAPSTPTKTRGNPRSARFDTGPLTAPLTSPAVQFPFTVTPSPSPNRKGGRKHKRAPSEGVFNMSSDEDTSTSTGDLKALFGLIERRPAVSIPAREQQLEREAASLAAGYFANSTFQNSPSPEDLPAPDF